MACALVACVTALSGCSDNSTSSETDSPWRVVGEITLIPFASATIDTCLGDYLLLDGQLQVTDCTTPGAMQVVGITSFGAEAPAKQPTDVEVATLADILCAPIIEAWAGSNRPDSSTPFEVFSYPDEWSGPETPLVCAVGA